eukprot:365109-Chlamydomonas_euryale.AAC.2
MPTWSGVVGSRKQPAESLEDPLQVWRCAGSPPSFLSMPSGRRSCCVTAGFKGRCPPAPCGTPPRRCPPAPRGTTPGRCSPAPRGTPPGRGPRRTLLRGAEPSLPLTAHKPVARPANQPTSQPTTYPSTQVPTPSPSRPTSQAAKQPTSSSTQSPTQPSGHPPSHPPRDRPAAPTRPTRQPAAAHRTPSRSSMATATSRALAPRALRSRTTSEAAAGGPAPVAGAWGAAPLWPSLHVCVAAASA